jgi:hypothetical protein
VDDFPISAASAAPPTRCSLIHQATCAPSRSCRVEGEAGVAVQKPSFRADFEAFFSMVFKSILITTLLEDFYFPVLPLFFPFGCSYITKSSSKYTTESSTAR